MERTTEDIERLLERWYDAATTDDEERELREWFRESGTLPAGLESARRMFAGFEALGAEKAGSEVLHPEADCPEEPAGTDVASCSKESFRLYLNGEEHPLPDDFCAQGGVLALGGSGRRRNRDRCGVSFAALCLYQRPSRAGCRNGDADDDVSSSVECFRPFGPDIRKCD